MEDSGIDMEVPIDDEEEDVENDGQANSSPLVGRTLESRSGNRPSLSGARGKRMSMLPLPQGKVAAGGRESSFGDRSFSK